jgi:adhesin transport system outer membrane protein
MPLDRKPGSGAVTWRLGTGLAGLLLLAGCMEGGFSPLVAKLGFDPARGETTATGLPGDSLDPQKEVASSLIADLQARQSVLPPQGAYAAVADAVIEASSGAAAAELRVKRLKAEAEATNWLPQIGPSVSLTSLSGLVASLLIEQALLDNGKRKAERAFAAADVEVAAVSLSTDINHRVYDGLSYYIAAARAREQAAIAERAMARLAEYDGIMGQRVAGGLSDRSEQQIVSQRAAEMRATAAGDRQAEATALAELAVLTGRSLDIGGLESVQVSAVTEPLSVLKARGEAARMIAAAKAQHAGLLPGVTGSIDIDEDGVNPGLRLGTEGLFGLGTGAALQALEATNEVADRQIAEAAQDAQRRRVALERDIASLQSRQAQGSAVLSQTLANLDMFTEQYKVGRRTLLELVGQFDSTARLERDQAALKYEIALKQLELARDAGALVDGERL